MYRALRCFMPGVLFFGIAFAAAAQTPLQECAQAAVPKACLDARLKQANLQLNAALKSATRRIEELQKKGERSVLSPFVNSQRQFNSYRDTNCDWQAIAVPQPRKAEFIKDCQIRATLAREQELLAFARGDAIEEPLSSENDASPTEVEEVADEAGESPLAQAPIAAVEPAAPTAPPAQVTPPVEPGAAKSSARAGVQWQLQSWRVDGAERALVPGSQIEVSFDPGGKVAGNGSVNRFSGDFRFDQNGRLVWPASGFAVTKMAGPPDLMQQERMFLQTLRRMRDFRSEGPQLILESASGKTVLTFARN